MSELKPKISPIVADLIETYSLQPHPEGGYFKETYRSPGVIYSGSEDSRFKGKRCYATAIYFLLPQDSQSKLHRIASDETWHFYLGGPMTLVILSEDGKLEEVVLGSDFKAGQKLQYTVLAGSWFGGFPNLHSPYSFVGCTVAPGFDFQDFELVTSDTISHYPILKSIPEPYLKKLL